MRNSTRFEYIIILIELLDKAFALQSKGFSMKPEFKESDIVIIYPTIKTTPSDFVVTMKGKS
ncbi:S24 family peptidase [Gilliamella sp. B2824]|uniref:S24 family peptidase n=1 Tax=Gilliamella sp. B2824 TaxID=2818019 RepID=UPI00226A4B29|nr:S24 family peptidase [Gilliamella sp. B2824]